MLLNFRQCFFSLEFKKAKRETVSHPRTKTDSISLPQGHTLQKIVQNAGQLMTASATNYIKCFYLKYEPQE